MGGVVTRGVSCSDRSLKFSGVVRRGRTVDLVSCDERELKLIGSASMSSWTGGPLSFFRSDISSRDLDSLLFFPLHHEHVFIFNTIHSHEPPSWTKATAIPDTHRSRSSTAPVPELPRPPPPKGCSSSPSERRAELVGDRDHRPAHTPLSAIDPPPRNRARRGQRR